MNEPFISKIDKESVIRKFSQSLENIPSINPTSSLLFFLDDHGGSYLDPHNPSQSRGLSEENIANWQLKNVNFKNEISFSRSKKEIRSLASQIFTLFNFLLLVEGVLSFILLKYHDDRRDLIAYGCFFLILIIINFIAIYVQEHRIRTISKFKEAFPPTCTVIRNRQMTTLKTVDLIESDLVCIKSGEKVPADIRIVSSNGLKIQRDEIFGESESIEIIVSRLENDNSPIEYNIFAGSKCVEGSGIGYVKNIGDKTVLGEIAQKSIGLYEPKNPLISKQIDKIGVVILVLDFVMIITALIIFLCCNQWDIQEGELLMLDISYGNIPQALPITLTICLIIIAHRFQKQKIQVKKLECIDSLSSASVLLCDKTGTMTMNKMDVKSFWCNERLYLESQILPLDSNSSANEDEAYNKMFTIACLCNKAEKKSDGMSGVATDQSLLQFCYEKMGEQWVNECRITKNIKKDEVPFSSIKKYQMVIYENIEESTYFLYVKGAHEVLLNNSIFYLCGNKICKVTEAFKKKVGQNCRSLTNTGHRIIGVAYKPIKKEEIPDVKKNLPNDLIFLGFFGFSDPLRPKVAEVLTDLRNYNLKIFMLTGDFAETAEAVANKLNFEVQKNNLNLNENDFSNFIHDIDLENLNDDQWKTLFDKENLVFARVTHIDKQRIIQKLKKMKLKTIMIGDGANDAIAMKTADVGIVMGAEGSEISKEASDLVFLDDNFESLVFCIRESRLFFDNLKNVVAYTLCHCILEVVPTMINVIFRIPYPFDAKQMLIIDIGTELLPALSLASLKSEVNTQKNPRSSTDSLHSWRLLLHSYVFVGGIEVFWCLFSYFLIFAFTNHEHCRVTFSQFSELSNNFEEWDNKCDSDDQKSVLTQVQGAWFMTVVLGQLSNLLLMVGIINPLKLFQLKYKFVALAVLVDLILLILIMFVPGINNDLIGNGEKEVNYDYLMILPWFGCWLTLFFYYKIRNYFIRRGNNRIF